MVTLRAAGAGSDHDAVAPDDLVTADPTIAASRDPTNCSSALRRATEGTPKAERPMVCALGAAMTIIAERIEYLGMSRPMASANSEGPQNVPG